MKKIFIILFSIVNISIYGQTIQSYSGEYEGGNATYQYYENEKYERILHGNFSYKQVGYNTEYVIAGQFKNNLRNGLWKATITKKNVSNITEIATATYVNGNIEGVGTYIKTDNTTKKILSKSTANFKNNVIVGKYKYDVNDGTNIFSVNINLNQEGYADSTSTIKYTYQGKPYENIQKYKNGFLYWELHRNMSDGSIISKIDRVKLIDEINVLYNPDTKISILPNFECSTEISCKDLKYVNNKGETINFFNTDEYYYKTQNGNYYENVPLTFLRNGFYSGYNSFWDLYEGINFWQNEDCGSYCSKSNPLGKFGKGAKIVSFLPIKELAIQVDIYSEYLTQKKISENKKRRKELLDSLKTIILLSIEWRNIEGGIFPGDSLQKFENFSISFIPITNSQYEGFSEYNIHCGNFDDNYYKQQGGCYSGNVRLEKAIFNIKNNIVENDYNLKPNYMRIEKAESIAKWIDIKIANQKQIEYAIGKGIIKLVAPNPYVNPKDKPYWFIK